MNSTLTEYLTEIRDQLALGDTEAARVKLDEAWSIARLPTERKTLHDLGNEIQRAILAAYMGGEQ